MKSILDKDKFEPLNEKVIIGSDSTLSGVTGHKYRAIANFCIPCMKEERLLLNYTTIYSIAIATLV